MADQPRKVLTTLDHARDVLGLRYVYAVNSRRAGGVSLGVNLNPNNACNWRCIYCQVPNLRLGAAPVIDLDLLRRELRGALGRVLDPAYLQVVAPPGSERVTDIAISGNGEPTTCKAFDQVVGILREALVERDLAGKLKVVLITNGSELAKPHVLSGITTLGSLGGEIWYKFDGATTERRRLVNNTSQSLESVARNLNLAADRCATRLQTCVLALDGEPPPELEVSAYVDFVRTVLASGTPLVDITLYGPDRQSHQPEAPRISKVDPRWLAVFAERIRALGLPVIAIE